MCPVSCVLNVDSASGLSILVCPPLSTQDTGHIHVRENRGGN
jgi:hypothetical protein